MGGALNNAPCTPVVDNAVQPAWRTASALALIAAPWDRRPTAEGRSVNTARLERYAKVIDPALRALASESAPFPNEANHAMPDLERQLFGPNLERLRRIKKKWDPENVYYSRAGVGSDAWTPDAEGRLCRST